MHWWDKEGGELPILELGEGGGEACGSQEPSGFEYLFHHHSSVTSGMFL